MARCAAAASLGGREAGGKCTFGTTVQGEASCALEQPGALTSPPRLPSLQAGAPTVPSSHDLLEIADELGIFADHLVEPMAADAGAAAATTPPPPSEELNNAVAAYPSSSSGATASSSGNAAALPRFLDAPAGAVAAVAAAVQAAADAGMPPLPAWQLQQQEAAAVALRLHGGKQGSSPPLMMGGSYASPFQLERLAFKVRGGGRSP